MIFFSLFSTALSSVFYGLIATFVIMALLYVVLRAISPSAVQTPIFLCSGVLLALLLLVQTSLMIAAIQAKSAADQTKDYLTETLAVGQDAVEAVNSQELIEAVTGSFPILGSFVDTSRFAGIDIKEVPLALHNTITDYLNSSIWHRVWWLLGFIVVACVLVIVFDEKRGESTMSAAQGRRPIRRVAPKRYRNF